MKHAHVRIGPVGEEERAEADAVDTEVEEVAAATVVVVVAVGAVATVEGGVGVEVATEAEDAANVANHTSRLCAAIKDRDRSPQCLG